MIERPKHTESKVDRHDSLETPSQFVKYLKEHGFPKLKDIELVMYYGSHATGKDAEDIFRQMDGIDVFLPELAGHMGDEEAMRGLSRGRINSSTDDTQSSTFRKRMTELLPGAQVFTAIADLPSGPLANKMIAAYKDWLNFGLQLQSGSSLPLKSARQMYTKN